MAPRSNYTSILEAIDAGRSALLRSRLSRGFTRLAAVILAVVAVVSVWGVVRVALSIYNVPAVAAVSLAAVAVVVAALVKWVVVPAATMPDRNRFVALVEKRHPESRNLLVNAYQLGREDFRQKHTGSGDVIDAVVTRARESLDAFDLKTWSSPRDDRRYLGLGLGSVVVLAVLALVWTGPLKEGLAQAVSPSLAAPPPVSLAVLPGNATVDRGADLKVGVEVQGTDKAPTLKVREPGGEWRLLSFDPLGEVRREGGRWETRLERIERNVEYAVTAPRAESGVFQVMVNDPPRLQGFRLNVQYPEYTRLPAETLESASGDITALKGSRVDVRVLTNVSVPQGYLEWRADNRDAPERVELQGMDPTQWSAQLPVMDPGSYAVVFADASGRELLRSPRYRVDPVPDRAPYLTLHLPQEDHDLYDDMMERVVADAADDYGFSAAEIVYRIDDGPESVQALNPFTDGQKEFRLDTLWDLSGLNLIPGQLLSFYVRVVDNDVITGPKAVQTDVRRVRFPTVAEMYKEVAEEHSQEIDHLGELQDTQAEVQERLQKLSDDLKRGKDRDWETEQEVKATLDRQQELEEQLSEAAERLAETMEKASSRADMDQSLVQKMSQLNELLESLSNPDLKRSFQRLSEALNKSSSDELRQAMEDFQSQQQEMLAGLDRTIELLKQIRKEEQVSDVVRRTEEIAQLQDEIAKEMKALGGVPPEPQQDSQGEKAEEVPQELKDLQQQVAQLEKELAEEMQKPGDSRQSGPEAKSGEQQKEAKNEAGGDEAKKDGSEPKSGAKENAEAKEKSGAKSDAGAKEQAGENPQDKEQAGEQGQEPSETAKALKEQLETLKQALDQALAEERAKQDQEKATSSDEKQQGDPQAGEQKSGEQPKEPQAGEQKSGEQQSGEPKSGEQQTGEQKSGEQQSSEQQSGEQQSGEQQAGDQDEQSAPTPQEKQRMEDLAQQQKELQEKLDDLKRRLQQLRKMHQEDPGLAKDLEEIESGETSRSLSESMQQGQQSMSQGQKQKSTMYAFRAREEANRLAQLAESAQADMQKGLQDDSVAKMERLIQGLIDVSRVEERLVVDPHDDEREQARHQYDLVELTDAYADSLAALSRQTFSVDTPDKRQLEDTIVRMERATRLYEMGNRRAGNHESRETVSDLNTTIVKLMKGHEQMCGGSGSGGGGMQKLMQQMQGLTQAQEQLNQQSGNAQSGGQRLSQTEKRRLEWLAAQQEMIREGLKEVQQEFQESDKLLGDMKSLGREMEDVETQLRAHNLDRRVLERQQKILTRLLDAQRSVRQQEMSPKRESRTGTLARRESPPPIPKELVQRDRALEEDVLRGAQDRYPSQYRKLVEDYFKALTEQTRAP